MGFVSVIIVSMIFALGLPGVAGTAYALVRKAAAALARLCPARAFLGRKPFDAFGGSVAESVE
jgi:hypothetical protein